MEEIIDDAEGVFVGGGVKIKGAAEEVARGRSIVGLYPATEASRAEFQRWRKARDGA